MSKSDDIFGSEITPEALEKIIKEAKGFASSYLRRCVAIAIKTTNFIEYEKSMNVISGIIATLRQWYGSEFDEKNVKINKTLRFELLKKADFKCQYCGRGPSTHLVNLHIDHRMPKSRGGKDIPSNYVVACSDCNIGKSDRLLSERN